MTLNLNSRALFLTRLDRTRSSREVAQAVGVSASTLNRLETGRNPDASVLTLAQYLRLCDTLGVSPETLIEQTDNERESTPDDDSRALLGLLLAIAGQAHIDVLAEALEWTLDYCHDVIDRINPQLRPLGLVIYHRRSLYSLRPSGADHAASLQRYRNHPRANQKNTLVSPGRGRLVFAAAVEPFPADALRDGTRKDVAMLITAGILALDPATRRHTLTDDARYSLALHD